MKFSNMFIVMLANSADREMYEMTYRAISFVNMHRPKNSILTLVETNVNIEKEPFYLEPYRVDRMLRNSPFNYNEALAYAVRDFQMLSTDIFCVLNNDIVVHAGAFEELVDALSRWDVVSAWADNSILHTDKHGEAEGYAPSHFFSGWAWMCKWSMIEDIGFEECFPPVLRFWYQDNWFIEQFKRHGYRHALIRKAIVTHLESRSHRLLDNAREATIGQKDVYDNLRGIHGI